MCNFFIFAKYIHTEWILRKEFAHFYFNRNHSWFLIENDNNETDLFSHDSFFESWRM